MLTVWNLALIVLGAALVCAWLSRPRFPVSFTARCVRVCDGDTIWVRRGMFRRRLKLRLIGMDAPESEQRFGLAAEKALSGYALGKTVRVTSIGTDRYGRWVSRVHVGGLDLSEAMIAQGLAWPYYAYFKNLTSAERSAYKTAFNAAKTAGIGLWQDNRPEPPWNWRKRHRTLFGRFVLWLMRLVHWHG